MNRKYILPSEIICYILVRIASPASTTRTDSHTDASSSPPSVLRVGPNAAYKKQKSSIGYEPQAGVYKVVRVCGDDKQLFEVLTLGGSGAWRTLRFPNELELLTFDNEAHACPLNGAIYFKAQRERWTTSKSDVIVAFVLDGEKFPVYPAPPIGPSFELSSLVQIGEKLGVLAQDYEGSLSIWIHEEELWRRSQVELCTEEPWVPHRGLGGNLTCPATEEDGTKTAIMRMEIVIGTKTIIRWKGSGHDREAPWTTLFRGFLGLPVLRTLHKDLLSLSQTCTLLHPN